MTERPNWWQKNDFQKRKKNHGWECHFRASFRPYAPPKTSQIKPLSCYRQPQKSRKIDTSPLCRPTSCCRRTFPSSELVVHTSSTLCQNFKCLPPLQPIFFLKKVIFPKVSKGNKGCSVLVLPLVVSPVEEKMLRKNRLEMS